MARHLGACALKIRSQKRCRKARGRQSWSSARDPVTGRHWLQRQGSSASSAPSPSRVQAGGGGGVTGRSRPRALCLWRPVSAKQTPCALFRVARRAPLQDIPTLVSPWGLGSFTCKVFPIPLLETFSPYFLDDVPRRDLESLPSLSTTAD